jgi:plasmid maintenance system killer protein
MTRTWGTIQAKKLRRRLDELKAASTLEVMQLLPGRCHELKGDRAGQISLDLEHPYRLVFEPANDPVPRKRDGGLNWTAITAVRIIGVVDTHD